MGADLYIEPLYSDNKAKYEALFHHAAAARDKFTACIPIAVRDAARKKEVREAILANGHPLRPGDVLTPAEEELLKSYDSVFKKSDELQAKVEELYEKMTEVGYFRDSYNDGSLFWKLGLSWWEMAREKKKPIINRNGNITPVNARRLKTLIEALPPIVITKADTANWAKGTTVKEVQEFFDKKRASFIEFLDIAIKSKLSIHASV